MNRSQLFSKSFIETRQAVTPEQVLKCAAMGIVASEENCAHTIKHLTDRGITPANAATAHKALNELRSGLLPSVSLCEASLLEIEACAPKNLY